MCLPLDICPGVPASASPANSAGYCDAGTLLQIVRCDELGDFRLVIDVVGVRRFRVAKSGLGGGVEESTRS